MTAARVRAGQTRQPVPGARLIRVTVKTVSPLTVQLPGGATVAGVKVAGLTYTANALAFALYQEPAVGPVFPIA